MFLLDTNVLFAAMNQAHVHHQAVSHWLTTTGRYASCGLTQIGVFRLLLMNEAMHGAPLDPAGAHLLIQDFTKFEQHSFVDCPVLENSFVGKTRGHKAAFDDYLVQIAASARCLLATLDQALISRWPNHTALIPQL
jgi:predicted nucleic acid-binding protein